MSDDGAGDKGEKSSSRTAVLITAIAGLIAALATAGGVVLSAVKDDPGSAGAGQSSSIQTPSTQDPTAQNSSSQPPPTAESVTLDQWVAEASKKCVELEQRSGQMEAALDEALAALDVGDPQRAVDVVHQTMLRMKDWYAELARIPAPPEYQGEISEAIRWASISFDHVDSAIQSAAVADVSGFNQGQQAAQSAQAQAAAIFGRLGARSCGSA
jgi:hypothetical protein